MKRPVRRGRKAITLPRGEVKVSWIVGTESFEVTVLSRLCPQCFAHAVTELPAPLRAKQTDGTTHVCNPVFGGCNQGYEMPAPPPGFERPAPAATCLALEIHAEVRS